MAESRITRFDWRLAWMLVVLFYVTEGSAISQEQPVIANVEVSTAKVQGTSSRTVLADASNVIVWLVPLDQTTAPHGTASSSGKGPRIIQRNKSFDPHVLVVEVGTEVQFPNKDPFFHNIFSLFDGKRFDLGLYEAGSTRSVRFDRPGVSYLFCNIHADMSAVVVAVETPYFGVSNRTGLLTIPGVPEGPYQLHVWYERGLGENVEGQGRRVVISNSSRSLGQIHVLGNPNFTTAHKNKYGQDYVPQPTWDYTHP